MNRDPNLISIPEAALLLGQDPVTTRKDLAKNFDYYNTVVRQARAEARILISLPLLCKWWHGETYEILLPQWYERLKGYREKRVA